MLFEPTLIVERMVIEKDDHVAYDERFHMGVNVIRGDNSSGKSTVLNFIFYGLGGRPSRLERSSFALFARLPAGQSKWERRNASA